MDQDQEMLPPPYIAQQQQPSQQPSQRRVMMMPPPPPQMGRVPGMGRRRSPPPTGGATIDEVRGTIVGLVKSQHGAKFLQRAIENAPTPEARAHVIDVILDDVTPAIPEVITDNLGQFLMPKFMEMASVEQRTRIVRALLPHLLPVSCSQQGAHGLQRLLTYMTPEQAAMLGEAMAPYVVTLSKDAKGNYLVQSYLKTFSPGPLARYVYDVVCEHLIEISVHKVGCTVVCRCIERADPTNLARIIRIVADNAVFFSKDQFANYVVQHIFQHCAQEHTRTVTAALIGHIAELCFEKFSSNVIEKALQAAQPDKALFESLLAEMTEGHLYKEMIGDQFGNFVVQKSLDLCTSREQHARLVRKTLPLAQESKSPYAQHIVNKLLRS
jgi:hypothetical protein